VLKYIGQVDQIGKSVALNNIFKRISNDKILEKKKIILTALVKTSEGSLFLTASVDVLNGVFQD
jgi:hypothetical protein